MRRKDAPLTPDQIIEREHVKEWVINNRGLISQVAAKCNCSVQYVHQVAYGRSTTAIAHHRIEDELKSLGWPGVTRPMRPNLRRTG
jgi:hypothetical protein